MENNDYIPTNDPVQAFLTAIEVFQEVSKQNAANHSTLDREISDILHSIEFGRNNAVDLVKLNKLLRTTLQKRREVKNQQAIISIVNSFVPMNTATMEKLQNRITKTRNQKLSYEARELSSLKY